MFSEHEPQLIQNHSFTPNRFHGSNQHKVILPSEIHYTVSQKRINAKAGVLTKFY